MLVLDVTKIAKELAHLYNTSCDAQSRFSFLFLFYTSQFDAAWSTKITKTVPALRPMPHCIKIEPKVLLAGVTACF